MKRSESREQAFMLVFERSFKEESVDEIIEEAVIGRNLEVDDYAYRLASDVCDHLPWLDETITAHSKKWKLNRMSRVALTILRLSLWEIDNVDTVPVGRLDQRGGRAGQKIRQRRRLSFVNGVLGAYVRAKGQDVPEARRAEEEAAASAGEAKAEDEAVRARPKRAAAETAAE